MYHENPCQPPESARTHLDAAGASAPDRGEKSFGHHRHGGYKARRRIRITFYRNYTELVDILFDYLEMQQFGLAQNPAAEEYLPQLIRSYFIFFHENRSLFQCIQTYNLLPRLYAALEAHLSSKAYLLISTYGFESPYEVSALTGMLSKILMDWIRSGMQESVEEMSSIVYNIITKYNCILIP